MCRTLIWGTRDTSFLLVYHHTGRRSAVPSSLLIQGSHGRSLTIAGVERVRRLWLVEEKGGENIMEKTLVRSPGGSTLGSSGER